jgi:drug/metabolite transporter (DMT)-like permease
MDSSTLVGVGLGLGAATGQSLSYFCTRLFVIRGQGAIMRLLVLGHLWMGAAGAAGLALLAGTRPIPPAGQWIWPVLAATSLYLLGQAALFVALRHADASRTSPLLGLKIIMLATASLVLPWAALSWMQWLAAGLAVAAALALHDAGPVPAKALVAVLAACALYCGSDVNIRLTMDAVRSDAGLLSDSLLGVALCYICAAIASLAVLPWMGRIPRREWLLAGPFAVTWMGSMVMLFGCFATVGVVYGNIMQSTRGLITVLLGAKLASLGMHHLEAHAPPRVLARRIAAAVLMASAVAIYAVG